MSVRCQLWWFLDVVFWIPVCQVLYCELESHCRVSQETPANCGWYRATMGQLHLCRGSGLYSFPFGALPRNPWYWISQIGDTSDWFWVWEKRLKQNPFSNGKNKSHGNWVVGNSRRRRGLLFKELESPVRFEAERALTSKVHMLFIILSRLDYTLNALWPLSQAPGSNYPGPIYLEGKLHLTLPDWLHSHQTLILFLTWT